MKRFIAVLPFIFSIQFSLAQINATADNYPSSGENCWGWIGLQYEDNTYNGPYTIEIYWDYNPVPFLIDSLTSFSSDTSITIYTPPFSDADAFIWIIDNNSDTTTIYAELAYQGMNGTFLNCSCAYSTVSALAGGGNPPYTYYFHFGGSAPDTVVVSADIVQIYPVTCSPSANVEIYDADGCGGTYYHPFDASCVAANSGACQKEIVLTPGSK